MITLTDIYAVSKENSERYETNEALSRALGIDIDSLLADPEFRYNPTTPHLMDGICIGLTLAKKEQS